MDGTGSGQREMQSPPVSTPCRSTGCVFYAHHLFDGMCSKCYKDLKEQMQSSSHSLTPSTPPSNNNSSININVQSASLLDEVSQSNSNTAAAAGPSSAVSILPAVINQDLLLPTISDVKLSVDQTGLSEDASPSPKEKTKKKRCDTCKKRVGLTGFGCRCGGHYCSVHRYSDMHNCAFNYHELAQSEIRRQNPVVAAEKIKKI